MKKISQKIIFFGTEDFSLTSLESLIDAGYDIAAVVTKPDSKRGRGHIITEPSVKKLANQHNIPVWQPNNMLDIIDDINNIQNPVGVLVSFGKIIPEQIIDLFSPGIINVHPSLLPKYRGPSPIESAIVNGDSKTGISIMQLSPEMDAGPVYGQLIHHLNSDETQPELYETLAKAGSATLLSLLPSIIDGILKPKPQNESQTSYSQLLSRKDALLDSNTHTAAEAERLVRAHLKSPKSKIEINNHLVIVAKSHVVKSQNSILDIEFKDGKFLSIDELVVPGKNKMSSSDYLSGYKQTNL